MLTLASNLEAARSQMAFTLGFHIILASLGVALPALMLIANYRGLRRNDADALELAQRWSKAVAVTFAVGAVTGTVLSFEFGLLWPAFTGRFGKVFGVLFAIEGICFFLEAIFIAIYIFGWKRLSPWTHFWMGVPVVVTGLGGAFSVVAVNSWMNQPQGYSPTTGDVTSVEPLKVIFNPAVPYEVPHMILAAYLVTGFLVASIYAVGMLRGRRDRIHRLGLLIPLTVACIVTPIQFAVGDSAARAIAKDQPIKFAAMECVETTSSDVTEYLGGRCTSSGVKGGIGIPGLDSWLVGWSTEHEGDRARLGAARRSPAGQHDAALGLRRDGGDLHAADRPRAVVRHRLVAQEGLPAVALVPSRNSRLGRRRRDRTGVRLDRDGGWAPALDRLQRHAHLGCSHAGGRDLVHLCRCRRALRRAGRNTDHHTASDVATLAERRRRGRRRPVRPGVEAALRRRDRGLAMSEADAVAIVLWIGATLYAVFGGADFGAGLWSLLAGGGDRGRRPRELIDWAIGPVWEANHVWLIFVLVVLWTGFSSAFEAIFSTLFIPLSLAALGIVLRGSGFAFQHTARRAGGRVLAATLFGVASLLTPFFMGTVVGAIAGGRVPVGNAAGDAVTSWCNPLSLVIGALFVATGAYLAAVFLVSDARRAGAPDLERYFRNRAIVTAFVTGALAAAGLVALHQDARFVFDGLTHEGLPLVIVSLLCGVAVLVLLHRGARRGARPLAAGAVAAVIWGWGVAQHPYLLPQQLTIADAAAPIATLTALLIVFGVAVAVVLPALALLFTLVQRNLVAETPQPTSRPSAPPPTGR